MRIAKLTPWSRELLRRCSTSTTTFPETSEVILEYIDARSGERVHEDSDNSSDDDAPVVALVTLNRPQVLNALSLEMGRSVNELPTKLRPSTRALVLTGMASSFSTGRDLKASKLHTKEQANQYMKLAQDSVLAIHKLEIPTIAAVNGHAYGWGLELALGCDLRVVAASATMCFPECGLGLFPGAGGTVLVTQHVGAAKAKELIFTSKRFTGKEAERWGLANEVVPTATACLDTAVSLARTIACNSPLGIQGAKKVIDQGWRRSFDEKISFSNELRFPLNFTDDFAEGIAAFEQKRNPRFRGK